MNINKFVQECILSNLKEVKLRDKPACSRQTESHTFLKNLRYVRNKFDVTAKETFVAY